MTDENIRAFRMLSHCYYCKISPLIHSFTLPRYYPLRQGFFTPYTYTHPLPKPYSVCGTLITAGFIPGYGARKGQGKSAA